MSFLRPRRRPLSLAILYMASLAACGGGARRRPAAAAAAAAGAATASWDLGAKGQPAWIDRGSAAIHGDGGRVFYGVGSAGAIRDPALLRGTADNRARAELARVFSTFTAALMQDHASSDGAQNVDQTVKTLAASSLDGVEIVDRYVAADGTLYALAALDAARVVPAIAQAKAQGLVKSDVTPVTVDDVFDAHARRQASPASPVRGLASAEGDGAPALAASTAPPAQTGAAPDWVDGPSAQYPGTAYLCGVGLAPERSAAEGAAYAAVGRILRAHVQASARDLMGAYSRTGAPDLQVQSSESVTQVSTDATLQGVQIQAVYLGGDGSHYALACLERPRVAGLLRQQIEAADGRAQAAMGQAAAAAGVTRLQQLTRAMDALLAREAANAQLRIVDVAGVGIASPYAPADVSAAFAQALASLRLGLNASGPYEADFRAALLAGLTARGYQVVDGAGDGPPLDAQVTASIRMEDAGTGSGGASDVAFARAVVQVEVRNLAAGRVIAAFSRSQKEGSRSREDAERRAVRSLAAALTSDIGGQLDAAMKQ